MEKFLRHKAVTKYELIKALCGKGCILPCFKSKKSPKNTKLTSIECRHTHFIQIRKQ